MLTGYLKHVDEAGLVGQQCWSAHQVSEGNLRMSAEA